MTCVFTVTNFPFDIQDCPIVFESWMHNTDMMTMSARKGGLVGEDVNSLEWVVSEADPTTKITTYPSGDYTQISYHLILERQGHFFVQMAVVPGAILGFVLYFGMFIDAKAAPARVGLALMTMLTQVLPLAIHLHLHLC